MRAAYIEATGPVDAIQVGELPTPDPGPGQVLVRVGAAAVNPIDLYVRSGTVSMPLPLPYIIGCDLAGTVEKLGPGSSRFRKGDRVWGSNQGLMGRQGTTAEFAVVNQDWLYLTPLNLADPDAAALALTGLTAHLGLFRSARLKAGETVYVSGGSGGVGTMVVQMAKAVGARVATTAGGPDKLDLCRSLGADAAWDYKTDDVPAALRAFGPDGIDVWFETQREPDLETNVPLLRQGGRMVLMAGRAAHPTLPLGSFYTRDCSLLGFAMFNATAEEQRQAAADINRWSATGQLRAVIGREYRLAEAAQAQRFLEENTLGGAGTLSGKVVVWIG